MHPQLRALFDEDQQECLDPPADNTPEHRAMRIRNKARRCAVEAIVQGNSSLSAEDYWHACIIFLHGDCPDDFWQAYTYALESIQRNYSPAKRLAASAYDRWLMYQGKPQKFGLQYVPDGVRLRLWDVDPHTTDEERAQWDVPPLQQLHEHARKATQQYDLSKIDMSTKPQWLQDAVQRWKRAENNSAIGESPL